MTRYGLDLKLESLGIDHCEEAVAKVKSSDEDEEEPHPLGFAGCRYGLVNSDSFSSDTEDEDPTEKKYDAMDEYRRRVNSQRMQFGNTAERRVRELTPQKQQYPPIDSFIDASIIPTNGLIQYAMNVFNYEDRNEAETTSELVLKSTSPLHTPIVPFQTPIETITRPYQLIQADDRKIQQKMNQERSKIARNHQVAVQGFQDMLRKKEEAADKVRVEQARIDAAADEAQRRKDQLDVEQQIKEDEKRLEQQREQDQAREKQRLEREAFAAQDEAERAAIAKEREYLVHAEKLMANLREVRASAATFEASTAPLVKKRRLQMKKLVGGRVNTLAENADKIRSVAAEVSQAIVAARDEDEMVKQQLAAGDNNYSREMGRGKRYLVDLLCSKVMVRVQSEGFNGQRGDGFPLGNMLALVSVDHKDFSLMLMAHIYTQCPTAIPRLPVIDSDATEEELMASLGMQQNADGTSETFKRFLDRTESIISLVADIMSSRPENHTLLGGHEAAITWLKRFLNALPDAPIAPLPLLTAPVLDAFLTGAGHMLANLHEQEFRPLLDSIMMDVIHRLDEGSIGAPSATRLKKTVSVGFDGFKRILPHKALPELYIGGTSAASKGGATFGSSQNNNPFQGQSAGSAPSFSATAGQSFQPATNSYPFGAPVPPASLTGPSTFAGATASPFGAAPSQTTSPFANGLDHDNSNMNTTTSSFPQSTNIPAFGSTASTTASLFGQSPSQFTQTDTSSASNGLGSTFGTSVNQASNNSSFGTTNPPTSQTNAFGNTFGSPNASSFGAPASNQGTPFASSGTSPYSASSPSTPFGGGNPPVLFGGAVNSTSQFGGVVASNTQFGGGGGAGTLNTQFGGGVGATASLPFGGAAGGTPFGVGGVTNAAPFGGGGAAANSPFGGGGGFGSSTSTSFGGGGAVNTAFGGGGGVTSNTPFGGGGTSSTPFGTSTTSFGGGGSSGFGQQPQAASNAFGQPQAGGPGGGTGRSKTPCKFFAKGSCRFGNNCKFSHESGGGGGGGFGAGYSYGGNQGNGGSSFQSFGSNPFGGPRR